MFLSDIDFTSLEDVTPHERWGANTDRDRLIYRDERFYYKVWGERYIDTTFAAVGAAFKRVQDLKTLHAFEVGLLTPALCAALRELITDERGLVRGYVTHKGKHPSSIPDAFVDLLFQATLDCGWVFSDLKETNVVVIDGTYSLIDYDTHLSNLREIDVSFEKEKGCLRAHVTPRYRQKIVEYALHNLRP